MLYLGCPIWTSKSWSGTLLAGATTPGDSLRYYSRLLPMVEANTTFYGRPSEATAARWREQTPPEFRFCLKVPRTISHDRQLVDCEEEIALWIDVLRVLGERAGPTFLQLPPDFGPDKFPLLLRFMENWPADLSLSVEPRNAGWFDRAVEEELMQRMRDFKVGRILYDGRPLKAVESNDTYILEGQAKKPRVPTRASATAHHIHVRYMAHTDLTANERWLSQWREKVVEWLDEGRDIYFCMHSLYDAHMPALCQMFHSMISEVRPLPPLPDPEDAVPGGQMSLF